MNTQHQEVTPIPPEHGVHISNIVRYLEPKPLFFMRTGQRYASPTTLEISMKHPTSRI